MFFFVPVKEMALLQMVTENTQKELSFVKGGHPILNSGHNKSRLFGLLCIRPIVRSMPGLVNQSPKFPQFCLKRPVFTSAGTFCTTFEVRCPSAHKLSNQASFCKKTHISALVSSKTFFFIQLLFSLNTKWFYFLGPHWANSKKSLNWLFSRIPF